jgi:short-subunit dehydrogenase
MTGAARPPPAHILITGASSGLGAGLARSYAAPGRALSLIARSAARLAAVARDCRAAGAQVRTATFDVGDAEPLGGWLLATQCELPFDLVIANAGTSGGPAGPGEPEGLALATRQIRTNLLGCLNTIEPLLPAMLRRPGAHVAMVSSVAGYRGLPYSPAYSASKAGIRLYGEALRAQLAPSALTAGVSVSVIVPGFFASPMTERFQGAKPMLRSLDQAVAAVRRGLDRRAPRVFPRLLGLGLQAADLLPARLGDLILRGVRFRIDASAGDAGADYQNATPMPAR